MAHELNPRQDDTFLEIGRILHENVYLRDKKEINTPDIKIDLEDKLKTAFNEIKEIIIKKIGYLNQKE